MGKAAQRELKPLLEALYRRYNRPGHARHDPVGRLYRYEQPADGEVAGLVAAFLAYGRLAQIVDSVEEMLARLGQSPHEFILRSSEQQVRRACRGFAHRFVDGDQMGRLLCALRTVLARHGSLEACFRAHDRPEQTILPGLTGLAHELLAEARELDHLVADPAKGSACKRWHLFLRWMVRRDAVDPGLWEGISPARLVVPLDRHMHRVCGALGLSRRSSPDLKTALQVTEGFRAVCPADPVRYDFALMHASAQEDPALAAYLAGEAVPALESDGPEAG